MAAAETYDAIVIGAGIAPPPPRTNEHLETNVAGVYAAGDIKSGPALVVHGLEV